MYIYTEDGASSAGEENVKGSSPRRSQPSSDENDFALNLTQSQRDKSPGTGKQSVKKKHRVCKKQFSKYSSHFLVTNHHKYL